MSEDNKILNFPSAKTISAVPESEPIIANDDKPVANPFVVQALKGALECAERGELSGIAIIAWNHNTEAFARWLFPMCNEQRVDNGAFKLMSALSLLERDLKELAHSAYPSMLELVSTAESTS